jgi:hypothetical protein
VVNNAGVRVFVPGKHFQASLMFVGKVGAYLSEVPLLSGSWSQYYKFFVVIIS